MPSIFKFPARKFKAAFERARSANVKATRPPSEYEDSSFTHTTSSDFDILPLEITIEILALCGLQDLKTLCRVSRAVRGLVFTHEQAIARGYLKARRCGSLPNLSETHLAAKGPEKDVVILSDLFPPPRIRSEVIYTFDYLHSLQKRQNVCSKLSYFLADRILDNYLQDFQRRKFESRKDQEIFREKAVVILQNYLTPLTFYISFFLEEYSRLRIDHQNTLQIDYDGGRLPVEIQPADRARAFLELQVKILRSPPFTNSSTLKSTHHCYMVLFTCLSRIVSPDPHYGVNDSWISMLLHESGLERIVELFAAEKSGSGSSGMRRRRDFMRNMQADWDAKKLNTIAAVVYGGGEPPSPYQIWLQAAINELRAREQLNHESEDIVEVWDGAKIFLSCFHCREPGADQA